MDSASDYAASVASAAAGSCITSRSHSKQQACTRLQRLWLMPLKSTARHPEHARHIVVINAPNEAALIGSSIFFDCVQLRGNILYLEEYITTNSKPT
jgi:hypothetical protein